MIVAATVPLGAGSAYAADFTVSSGTDITAKTLAAGNTGTVASGAALSISGSGNAITLSATSGTTTIINSGSILQTGTGRTIRNNTSGTPSFSITNNSGALIRSADADTIRADIAGSNWTIINSGTISSLNPSAAGSQAIDFDAVTTGIVSITNNVGGQITAFAADAIRPGANAVIINAGTISATLNPLDLAPGSDGIDTQNRSGVSVTNTGSISGRHGITGGAVNGGVLFTTSVTNNVGGTIQGLNGSGINLDGFNANQTATITNRGTIIGNGTLSNSDGDGIDVDGIVNITNYGIIRSVNANSTGLTARSEGITVGGGTITNSGTIEGLVAAGNTNAVGVGISLLGNDSLTLPGTREAIYGNAVVTNQAGGLIRGQTDSGIYVDGPASGFTVVINNNAGATILGGGTTNAAIRTNADNDTINNAGTIDGSSSGKAIDMGAGNNALYITGGSALVIGDINGGVGGTNTMTVSPGLGNSFVYGGSISNFSTFEVLSGTVTLTGVNTFTGVTKITGGTLVLDGANRIAAASALALNGGTLRITNAGGANGQTFSSLALLDNSVIDLGNSSLTFNGLGTVIGGKTLAILGYTHDASPDFAFRFFGDYSANSDFLALIGATTINGLTAQFLFDGTYTDVTLSVAAVPEPETYAMLLVGLGLLGFASRRRNQKHAKAA